MVHILADIVEQLGLSSREGQAARCPPWHHLAVFQDTIMLEWSNSTQAYVEIPKTVVLHIFWSDRGPREVGDILHQNYPRSGWQVGHYDGPPSLRTVVVDSDSDSETHGTGV